MSRVAVKTDSPGIKVFTVRTPQTTDSKKGVDVGEMLEQQVAEWVQKMLKGGPGKQLILNHHSLTSIAIGNLFGDLLYHLTVSYYWQ